MAQPGYTGYSGSAGYSGSSSYRNDMNNNISYNVQRRNRFGAPYGLPPPQQFGAPQVPYGQPPQQFGAPQVSYGQPPQQFGVPQVPYGEPSQQFGPPELSEQIDQTSPYNSNTSGYGGPNMPVPNISIPDLSQVDISGVLPPEPIGEETTGCPPCPCLEQSTENIPDTSGLPEFSYFNPSTWFIPTAPTRTSPTPTANLMTNMITAPTGGARHKRRSKKHTTKRKQRRTRRTRKLRRAKSSRKHRV